MAGGKLPPNRKPRNDLTAEFVRSVLDYDPLSGILTWKTDHAARARKGQIAGRAAANGRVSIGINGGRYYAYRIAHLIMTGEWPHAGVDHKFGETTDNRWDKLRPATQSENGANSKLRHDSTSGFKGVSWSKSKGRWRAHITHNYKFHHLGYFDTAEEAHEAYKKAAKEIYDEFARNE
jgi:hypothetical protein